MSAFDDYRTALADVPEVSRATVERLCSQAVSYVWGFQDAGGEVKDTERSTEFGYAYGIVAAKYEWMRNGLGSRPPIQDAWRSWQQFGEIRAWDGARLDGPLEVFPEDADADKTFTEDDQGNWHEVNTD